MKLIINENKLLKLTAVSLLILFNFINCNMLTSWGILKGQNNNDSLLLASLITMGNSNNSKQEPAASTTPIKGKILMFVSYERTYYSEFKVSYEALRALGYEVEIRSSGEDFASAYTVTGDIVETANNSNFLTGASYNGFVEQYSGLFGKPWDSSWNTVQDRINLNGKIQDVPNMDSYLALVVPGGDRATDYRLDGSYPSQTNGSNTISASEIGVVANKINQLSLDALSKGKPILFQCHAASLAAYLRLPNTGNPGTSLLSGQPSAGYPIGADGGQTQSDYGNLGVSYRNDDRVVVSSPNSGFIHNGNATNKIITMRDWYPQTIAYSIRTLINILESYPEQSNLNQLIPVLLLHGGSVNLSNGTNSCLANNRSSNDVPCNYAPNIPADYTDLESTLTVNSPNDEFQFDVTSINLSLTNTSFLNNKEALKTELKKYKSVIFFKHWNTFITQAFQDALYEYADEGGGLISLHHGLYNDNDAGGNKNKIIDIFQAQSFGPSGFGASIQSYNLFSTNYGHFISTYGVPLSNASTTNPSSWTTWNPAVQGGNSGMSTFQNFSIQDEIYHNMIFLNSAKFGRDVNQIQPLFSNNLAINSQMHTSGFLKKFNPSGDSSVGKVVYLQPGERPEIFNIINSPYTQIIRNAVYWSALGK